MPGRALAGALFGVIAALGPVAGGAQTLRPAEMRLPNGLRVLAIEDHALPSVALSIRFGVGSRNERPGITGISHLFEHMMFNGSRRYAPGVFDRVLEAGGGSSNAGTGPDETEYYEEFHSSILHRVLEMEADRMAALRIDRHNLEQERGIVKEERRVSTDDSVEGSMRELLFNMAFAAHPYRWDVIGFMKDLDAIRLEDARAYFRTYYAPGNAVMAVVGDFRAADLFAAIRRLFGPIPRGAAVPAVVNAEPEPRGERRADLHRDAQLPAVLIGYRIGSFRDRDDPALDMLSTILASGESSRLHRTLVRDRQIATSVSCSNDSRLDAGILEFHAQAQTGHTAHECEQAITEVLAGIAAGGVPEREMQKARNGLRAGWVRSFTTNLGRAQMLTHFEGAWGAWRRYSGHLEARLRVTSADIQRVIRTRLTDRRRTVVTLVLEHAGAGEAR